MQSYLLTKLTLCRGPWLHDTTSLYENRRKHLFWKIKCYPRSSLSQWKVFYTSYTLMNHCYTFPVTLFQGLCLVRLLLFCLLQFCLVQFRLLQFCLLLHVFRLLNFFTIFSCKSTQLKFNVQFNVL